MHDSIYAEQIFVNGQSKQKTERGYVEMIINEGFARTNIDKYVGKHRSYHSGFSKKYFSWNTVENCPRSVAAKMHRQKCASPKCWQKH